MTADELRAYDADIILVAPCGFDRKRATADGEKMWRHAWWRELRAVKEGKVTERMYVHRQTHHTSKATPRRASYDSERADAATRQERDPFFDDVHLWLVQRQYRVLSCATGFGELLLSLYIGRLACPVDKSTLDSITAVNMQESLTIHRLKATNPHPAPFTAYEQVYALDGNAYYARPGPRLLQGCGIIARLLHGDAAGDAIGEDISPRDSWTTITEPLPASVAVAAASPASAEQHIQ